MTTVPPPAEFEGVLVRVRAVARRWAERLPPVPAGYQVTVSFTASAPAQEEALEQRGYRVVGVRPGQRCEPLPTADLLVPQALIFDRPEWWRALVGGAQAVFDLAFGPVQTLLADVVRDHLSFGGTVNARLAPRRRRP